MVQGELEDLIGDGQQCALVLLDMTKRAIRSGLFSNTGGSEDAGQLIVSAPTLHLEGGRIQALAADNSQGNAGSLEVRVGRLTLTGGAQISTTTRSKGRGGQLTVTATDAITIVGADSEGNSSALFSNTGGSGDAGQLIVSAPTLHLEGGRIQALAADNSQGNAGSLRGAGGALDPHRRGPDQRRYPGGGTWRAADRHRHRCDHDRWRR